MAAAVVADFVAIDKLVAAVAAATLGVVKVLTD